MMPANLTLDNDSCAAFLKETEQLHAWILVEAVYQLLFFVLGFVNFKALWRICKYLAKPQTRLRQEGRLARLSLHLIIANLAVLWVYCLSKTVWLLTYFWYGGDALCKLLSFLHYFCFQLWSNMVAAIALDLFYCVVFPLRAQRHGSKPFTCRLTLAAWTLSVICALPQLFLRGLVQVPCVTKYQCSFLYWYEPEITIAYGLYHAITVFYLPLLIIIVCYGAVFLRLGGTTQSHRNGDDGELRRCRGSKFNVQSRNSSRSQKILQGALGRRRLIKITAAIVGTYVLTWLPYQVFAVWQLTCRQSDFCAELLAKLDWLAVLMLASTCINPFLYRFHEPDEEIPSRLISLKTEKSVGLIRKRSRSDPGAVHRLIIHRAGSNWTPELSTPPEPFRYGGAIVLDRENLAATSATTIV